MRIGRVMAAVGVVAAGTLWSGTAPAAADVVTPPGACVGTGTWTKAGRTYSSPTVAPGATLKVPRADTVQWAGSLRGAAPGAKVPRRPIAGRIEAQLPPPIGWITVDDWGKTSEKAANTGSHTYDAPTLAAGVKVPLRGQHSESGRLVCRGSVTLQIDGGTNPLLFGGAAGTLLSAIGLVFAARPKGA